MCLNPAIVSDEVALQKEEITLSSSIVSLASTASNSSSGTSSCADQKRYTRAELRQNHNTPYTSSYCIVYDDVLDITEFSKHHPGGDLINLVSGLDATIMYETYHPRGVPKALVDKLTIGRLVDEDCNQSFYDWSSDFYPTLRQRVVEKLASLGRPRRGGYEIQIKAAIILIWFWASLYKMCVAPSLLGGMLWSMSMGIAASFVGTCIQHDGNHGAFSETLYLNKIAGWTLDMIGASGFTWEIQHMLGHHPHTNLLGVSEDGEVKEDLESDPDVFSSFPFVRMHPHHERSWFHAYQHLYAPILFAFMTLLKVIQQDLEVILSNKLYHLSANGRYYSVWNRARFWGMKVLSVVYMFLLPIYFQGWKKGAFLYIFGHLTCGEMLATMFIVNHVIEGVAFATTNNPDKKPVTCLGVTPMEDTRKAQNIKNSVNESSPKQKTCPLNDWAAVQCQTSVNWSSGSWFWNHFSGGLSHQIEHHLFPGLCHTNSVHIHETVKKTCEEYGVPYRNEDNLWVAYWKMMNHLKFLGNCDGDYPDYSESKKNN